MRWIIWILLLAFLIFSENRLRTAGEEKLKPIIGDINPPDLSIGISKDELVRFYEVAGAEGRELYANILINYDFLYPLSYGLFFAFTIMLLSRGFKKRFLTSLALLPMVAMLADMTENAGFILLAYEHPNFNDSLFQTARTAQLLKWYLAFASLVVIIGLLIAHVIRHIRRPKTA